MDHKRKKKLAAALVVIALAGGTALAVAGEQHAAAADMAEAAPPDAGAPVIVDPAAGTVAPAPGTLPARIEANPVEVGREVVESVKDGQGWRFAAAGALGGLMILGIRFLPWLFGRRDRGKAITIMVLALLGSLSSSLAGVAHLSLPLFTGAVGVAFTAVGGRQWISRLLWPRDGGAQWATWLQPWLGVKDLDGPPF